jgi:lipoprotein-anchoring transpeptidase ErfK/SrfK
MTRFAREARQPPGFRWGVGVLALLLLGGGTGSVLTAPAQAGGHQKAVSQGQPLVVLMHPHVARVKPNSRARRIETIRSRRPLTGVRTVLPVLGRVASSNWVRVRLPGRPNGHTGWIPTSRTRATSTEWRLQVKLSAREVTVSRDGRVVRRFRAVVGKPSTPTPRGRFFVEEALALGSQEAGAPFALATSARSNVFGEFDGGPGQIALHGTDHLSGALGTAASHGCVRLGTRSITWLARRIGSGVPLTITR